MTTDELYMQRCLDLARLGGARVRTNPMVGAVLVYGNRIIGEGYHAAYGEAHAEVQAIGSVAESDRPLIPQSTLYVSLEPCCIYGKTPPCTNLIIERGIRRVVLSCLDETPQVAGKGVRQLRDAGIEVISGIMEAEGRRVSAIRRTIVTRNRPYVTLKFARTRNGFFGRPGQQVWISHPHSKRLTHKWRSEHNAILVGTGTAATDNPALTNRYYFGSSPLRVVLDRKGRLSPDLQLFSDGAPTLCVSAVHPDYVDRAAVELLPLSFDEGWLGELLRHLVDRQVGALMVEGGAQLIRQFLAEQLWDEARVLIGQKDLPEGIPAPLIPGRLFQQAFLGNDQVQWYRNPLD